MASGALRDREPAPPRAARSGSAHRPACGQRRGRVHRRLPATPGRRYLSQEPRQVGRGGRGPGPPRRRLDLPAGQLRRVHGRRRTGSAAAGRGQRLGGHVAGRAATWWPARRRNPARAAPRPARRRRPGRPTSRPRWTPPPAARRPPRSRRPAGTPPSGCALITTMSAAPAARTRSGSSARRIDSSAASGTPAWRRSSASSASVAQGCSAYSRPNGASSRSIRAAVSHVPAAVGVDPHPGRGAERVADGLDPGDVAGSGWPGSATLTLAVPQPEAAAIA